MGDWDLKPSRILMDADTYRDLVIFGLCEEGWSESDARVEANRRLDLMSKDQETHLRESDLGGNRAWDGPCSRDDSSDHPGRVPMTAHVWEIEYIDGGHVDGDFWICRTCGASGGPAGFGGEPPFMDPFLAGTGLKVGFDCDQARVLIERRKRDRSEEQAFRDSMPSYLNPHSAEDRKTWRAMQSGALSTIDYQAPEAEHHRSPEAKEARRVRVHEVRDTWLERMADVDATVARIRGDHDPEIEAKIKAERNTIKLIIWARERFEVDLLVARCLIEGHPVYQARYSEAPTSEQHQQAATLWARGGGGRVDQPSDDVPMKTGNPIFARLPERFRWTFHNLFAHPVSEILYQVGFEDWGNSLHDWSIPLHDPEEEGRG